ncbi:MAG TPA: PAS domain S-box protein [Hydrogenophaga sp.]
MNWSDAAESRPSRHRHRVLEQQQYATLKALLITLTISTALAAVAVFIRDGATALDLIPVIMLLAEAGLAVLLRMRRLTLVVYFMVLMLILGAAFGTVLDGSVRSGAALIMLSSMVIAGSYLPRPAAIATGLIIVIILAGLNWLEQQGILDGALHSVDWTIWIVQAVVVTSILITALHGRHRLLQVVRDQENALALAHATSAKLKQSQGRFEALFQGNPVACLVQSLNNLEVLDANDAFCQLLGYSREDLIGKKPPRIWIDQDAMRAFQVDLQTHHRVRDLRQCGRRQDGSTLEVRISAEVLRQGLEDIVLIMVMDVTAEERSRRSLEKSQERFAKAFQFSPLGMSITRLSDGGFVEVNPAIERVLGYSPQDILGKTTLSANVWVAEDDRNQYIDALKQHGQLAAYETHMRSKAGDINEVRVWAQIIELDGDACVMSYVMNVSAEKRREALLLDMAKGVSGETGEPFFRSLVQHLSTVLHCDLVVAGEIHSPGWVDTVAVSFNGQMVPNMRYALEGTPCSQALQTYGESFFTSELADRWRQEGLPIGKGYQAYLGVALRDADGSPIGILKAMWTDQRSLTPDTEALMTIFSSRCNAELIRMRRDREIQNLRATLERRVEERTGQLEQLNRELDSFAYTVSHDLKSPLRSIDGFTHLLREQLATHLTDDDHHLFDRIEGSVKRMNALIVDLLALAHVSQGQLQRRDVNLSELAQEVLLLARAGEPKRSVEVVIEGRLNTCCDDRLAHIVLENLLGNAWKYTGNTRQARIEIGRLPAVPDEPTVFFVKDNGAGFDMSRSDRLFKPFNRLHASHEFEGSGIGLATVRRILERHGGFIRAQAKVGEGATFEFSFGRDPGT